MIAFGELEEIEVNAVIAYFKHLHRGNEIKPETPQSA
jgi:hypothetical protein